jgi:hypothetical protein
LNTLSLAAAAEAEETLVVVEEQEALEQTWVAL